MLKGFTRRRLFRGAGNVVVAGLAGSSLKDFMAQENSKGTLGHTQRRTERPLTGKRRLLYNYDAWGPFLKGHSTEKINANIDVFLNTQVTTVMLSPNAGQSLTYPSKA